MPNTRNDTATVSLKPIICTRPNLQMLILKLPGPLCFIGQKEVSKGELNSLKELYSDDGTFSKMMGMKQNYVKPETEKGKF